MLYSQPHLYDALYDGFTEDVEFWVERAAAVDGPICELACGSGRVTVPLAKHGLPVLGTDINADMLEAAARRAEREGCSTDNPMWAHADMREILQRDYFKMVIIPLHSLSHLHSAAEIRWCFQSVHAMLAQDGLLAFAIHNPSPAMINRDPEALTRIHEDISDLAVYESTRYASDTQLLSVNWYVESAVATQRLSYELRMIFPQEVPLLLELAGFEMVVRYGWYDGSVFGPDSGTQIVIARRVDETE